MYLVDTNIFLEVFLSRARKDECKMFLGFLRDGKKRGIVTDFSVHSIIVVMNGLGRLKELRTFLLSLLGYRGLYVYPTSISEEVEAVDLAAECGLDMDDAIQYSSALSVKTDAIVSFDRHFDGLEIPRMEPTDVA